MHSACTWFFHHVHLDRNLPNLGRISWISRKTDRKNAWALLLSLLFACSRMILVEGYVHGNANIQLSSPKLWLLKNHREVKLRELSELLEIEFGSYCPEENNTTSDTHSIPLFRKLWENCQGLLTDFGGYVGNSKETAHKNHVQTINKQTHGICMLQFACKPGWIFEDVLHPNASCSPQIHCVERSFAFLQHLLVNNSCFSALCCFISWKASRSSHWCNRCCCDHVFEAEFPKLLPICNWFS